jgi:hypothetical protein
MIAAERLLTLPQSQVAFPVYANIDATRGRSSDEQIIRVSPLAMD